MSCFSTALTKTLYDLHWTQKQLADETGINRPQINRYAKGSGGIELSGVRAVLNAVPEEYRAELLVAWLKDQTPEDSAKFVRVEVNDSVVREEAETFKMPAEADPQLRSLIQWVTSRCIHNKDFRTVLENMCKLIDG